MGRVVAVGEDDEESDTECDSMKAHSPGRASMLAREKDFGLVTDRKTRKKRQSPPRQPRVRSNSSPRIKRPVSPREALVNSVWQDQRQSLRQLFVRAVEGTEEC